MGRFHSPVTRVQPVFDALRAKDSTGAAWLPELWRLAAKTRGNNVAAPPAPVGTLLPGKVYDRTVPPATAFLRWAAAQEALANIERRLGGKGSGQKWWTFEGYRHADAYFETSECVLLIEGKRTEPVSASTRGFGKRNQLWRNVEDAQELAGRRAFGVMVGVESHHDGETALAAAESSLKDSYPHLDDRRRTALDRHLLGFVVWSEVVAAFNLPASVLRESC